MDMFMLVVVCFNFQAGEIHAVPAGHLDRESAALGAGGIGFEDFEFFATGAATGGAGGAIELQFRLGDDDRACAGLADRPYRGGRDR